ncbi:hypothetical protein [Chitinimonas sp.]|uniref:hypothetical protein n=1 Tax=Chitinimonas sp. TaxID=1934313 RepID=UPI0035AFA60A
MQLSTIDRVPKKLVMPSIWHLSIVIVWSLLLLQSKAHAISNNNSMVINSMTALSAQVCTGQTKITTCGKMRGSVDIVAGVGSPSTYSMDELAFIKDSGSVGGVSPSNFSGTGTASAGTPSNSATLMC